MPRRNVLKIAAAVILVAAVAAIWFSPLREHLTRENVRAAVEQVRGVWYGPILFALAFAAGCVFALPASVFVVSAGFIWGAVFGGIYSIIAGMLGATASFFLARFIGEGLLDRFGRIGRMVARQIDHAGFSSLLAIRFVPGIPFAVVNYGAGVTSVRYRDFFLSTLIGITPAMFVFSYCADALFNGSMTQADALRRLSTVLLLLLALTLLPRVVRRFGRSPKPELH
jgi:uncharacterized membrane protein YdjX (TVP38/TMEM64 family)